VSLSEWTGPLAYLAIFVATVVEGEAVFVAAAALAQAGRLDPAGVFVSAALGGSAGDQLYFYALRGRLSRWLDRFPALASRRYRVAEGVSRHATGTILACRFLPGLRVAIPAACALSGVSPLRFSILSLASSLAWAGTIVGLVTWAGPGLLSWLGVHGWWVPLVPAALVLGAVWSLGARERRRRQAPGRTHAPVAPSTAD
jgi:membrane protein DedA with SNARE-associated domain